MKISEDIKTNAKAVITAVQTNNAEGKKYINLFALLRLIVLTSRLTCPTIIRIKDYVSSASNLSEVADCSFLIGVKYGNAREASIKQAENLDAEDILAIQNSCTPSEIKGFKYINKKGLTADEYCAQVRSFVLDAIAKKCAPKVRKNMEVIRINSVLKYFINTGNINMLGEKLNSKITKLHLCPACSGEYMYVSVVEDSHTECPICHATIENLTANKPATVAGWQVDKFLNSRASKVQWHTVSQIGSITIQHENLELVPTE
jgi:hypothetical protein